MDFITNILQRLLWVPARIILRIFVRFSVSGIENIRSIDQTNGVLFVSNHPSQLDPLVLTAGLPFFSPLWPMHFVSLEPKYYSHIPIGKYLYGGLLFKMWGAYAVRRGLRDYELSLAEHIKLLHDHRSVAMFPEGGISKDGGMGDPRPGVAFLARRTNVIIVPVALNGLFETSLFTFLTFRQTVSVVFGKPVKYSGENADDIMNHVRELVAKTR